jgi:hypothetical protein
MATKKFTDTTARNAKPDAKPYKVNVEKGLYLLVTPTGGKWWRFDYAFDGKRKTLSMGVYPDVGLAAAQERRDVARNAGQWRELRRTPKGYQGHQN